MTVPTKQPTPGDILESVLIKGDLAKLTEQERTTYYMKVCQSIGLNPLTQPFKYIRLNNELKLYATRDCADQLRKLNDISIHLISREVEDEVLIVHAGAKDKADRVDEDLGAVAFPPTLRGETRANAILKCVTKAKRRVTLSISGLGFLDELEVEDIPAAARRPVARANAMLPTESPPPSPPGPTLAAGDPAPAEIATSAGADGVHEGVNSDPNSGVHPSVQADDSERVAWLDVELGAAAEQGWHALKKRWDQISNEDAAVLNAAMNNRHRPRALEIERARRNG